MVKSRGGFGSTRRLWSSRRDSLRLTAPPAACWPSDRMAPVRNSARLPSVPRAPTATCDRDQALSGVGFLTIRADRGMAAACRGQGAGDRQSGAARAPSGQGRDLSETIKELQAAGCESRRAIAAGFEERGIPAAPKGRDCPHQMRGPGPVMSSQSVGITGHHTGRNETSPPAHQGAASSLPRRAQPGHHRCKEFVYQIAVKEFVYQRIRAP